MINIIDIRKTKSDEFMRNIFATDLFNDNAEEKNSLHTDVIP
jgi:hypothetical protein